MNVLVNIYKIIKINMKDNIKYNNRIGYGKIYLNNGAINKEK